VAQGASLSRAEEKKQTHSLTSVHCMADANTSGNSDTHTVMSNYGRIMLCIISSSEALMVFCVDKPNSSYLISEIQK